ncbi:acyl carrier protein [Tistrella sp.]|uniref:acyl carrier protein n=1 Tax=Tistrella sp. TaxID=2024861 RepID=UPI000C95D378|nr:acyl carrier protein [Tistrella sp.]MAD37588.1 acyl carrier protein [Tistrella sp.]
MTDSLFDDVVTRIGEYLETDVSHLTPDSKLATSIDGLNSLKMFEMILYLEDCFGVEFDEAVMDRIDTLGGLVDHIREQRAAAA